MRAAVRFTKFLRVRRIVVIAAADFKGQSGFRGAHPEVRVMLHPRRMEIEAEISTEGPQPVKVTIVTNAYRLRDRDHRESFVVGPRRGVERTWSLGFTGGWYDFTVTVAAFERRFAGRLETRAGQRERPGDGDDGGRGRRAVGIHA